MWNCGEILTEIPMNCNQHGGSEQMCHVCVGLFSKIAIIVVHECAGLWIYIKTIKANQYVFYSFHRQKTTVWCSTAPVTGLWAQITHIYPPFLWSTLLTLSPVSAEVFLSLVGRSVVSIFTGSATGSSQPSSASSSSLTLCSWVWALLWSSAHWERTCVRMTVSDVTWFGISGLGWVFGV